MMGLFVKDVRMALQQKKFFLLLIAISILLNIHSDGFFIIGYLTFVCTFFVFSTIAYDENENGYVYLMTLPIKRKTFVLEKYLFGVFMCTLSWTIGCLIAIAFYVTGYSSNSLPEGVAGALLIYFLTLIFLSISLPVQYQFGVEKGKIVILFIFGIICLAAYFGNQIAGQAGYHIEQIVNRLFSRHMVWMEACLCSVTLISLLLSALVSIFIMNKKEL